ncbi:MAG TPA: type II secretion system protein, partial [Gammaproteobacteria bacterium]
MRMLQRTGGFTLVELVMTIVLLGIISAVLAPVITTSVTAYTDTRSRNELIARGRIALGRLAREIHQAVPNSLRVLAGDNTIEFVTASAGGRYVDRNDTLISSCATARRFRTGFNLTQLCLLNPQANFAADGDTLVIGNTSPTTLQYGSSRVTLNGDPGGGPPLWTVAFSNHTFNEASPGMHFNIVDATHEVGLVSGTDGLRWRMNNGISLGLYDNAATVSTADPLLIDGVSGITFTYNAAADGMLNVNLRL